MTRTYKVLTILLALTITALALPMFAEAKGKPVRIYSSSPADGVQGETWTITLSGDGFEDAVPEVRYIHKLTGVEAPNSKMGVSNPNFVNSEQITYTLSIGEYADPGEYDIEIYYVTSGRKGKGTTLFSVIAKDGQQPSECMLDFDAYFDDAGGYDSEGVWQWFDGLRNDGLGDYYAFGGTGMRLDTNGSQSLERKNDTRFLTIDFTVAGECDRDNPYNPGGAAGFCTESKGVDMRFEHQEQELQDNGLCLLDWKDPDNNSMRVTVGISFKQSSGDFLLGDQPKNPDQTGTVRLNYGCQAQHLLQSDLRTGQNGAADYRTTVTRLNEFAWRVEGEWACLHNHFGEKLTDGPNGQTTYLRIPFGLTLEDVNAPPNP